MRNKAYIAAFQVNNSIRGFMKQTIAVFLAALLFCSLSVAEVDLLPQFSSRWDGEWTLKTDGDETYYRAQTTATWTPSFIEYTPSKPISMDQKYLYLRMRINSLAAWSGIEVRLSSDNDYNNFYSIAIPHYSDPDFNILQSTHWADYTITLGDAKKNGNPDIKRISHIGFYIQGQQVTEPETFAVDFSMISIRPSLHSGIVSFTFDDGYDEHFEAAQIMKKYNLRGTAYVMTNEINAKGYLTSEQLKIMANEYHWGISSHHFTPITDMTEKQYNKEMKSTFKFLKGLGLGDEIFHFAYPLGKQNREKTLPWIRETFKTARVAGGGAETLPPSDWMMLKTFNVTPDISAEDLLKRIQLAKDNNEWLILMFHMMTPDATATDPLVYPFEQFEKLCQGISKIGIPSHPVHEVYEAFHE